MAKKKGLGRGLEALIPSDIKEEIKEPQKKDETDSSLISELKISEVEPNSAQPRSHFDEEGLVALSESIAEYGVLQPIFVSKNKNGFYKIIAGERRWRAAKMAGLKKIPAIVKEITEKEITEIALIENLQREDLNPIEEAKGYKELMEVYHLTQDDIARKMGKSRSAVANCIRLLGLSGSIQQLLIDKKLSSGHARALLAIEDEGIRLMAAEKIIAEGLNVRQTESYISKLSKAPKKKEINKNNEELIIYMKSLEKNLAERLGTKVKIHHGKNKGKIEIEYYSNDDFERIMGYIK